MVKKKEALKNNIYTYLVLIWLKVILYSNNFDTNWHSFGLEYLPYWFTYIKMNITNLILTTSTNLCMNI